MFPEAAPLEQEDLDQLVQQETTRYLLRDPRVAAVLSGLVMGLGQLFNAQYKRAFVFFGGELAVFLYLWDHAYGLYVSQTLSALTSPEVYGASMWLLAAAGVALWAYNILDAYRMAEFCRFIYERTFPLLDEEDEAMVHRHVTIDRAGLSVHRGLSRKLVFLGTGVVLYSAALIGLGAFYLGRRDQVPPAQARLEPAPRPVALAVPPAAPTDPQTRLKTGELRFDTGDLTGAQRDFEAVLALEAPPRIRYQALVDLGRVASARGDDARASEMLLQAVALSKQMRQEPQPAQGSPLARADSALRKGDPADAERLLAPVAADSQSWRLLARTASSRGEWERARKFLAAYVATPEPALEAYLELARAEFQVGRRAEAIVHAERFLKGHPGDVDAALLHAQAVEAEQGAAVAFRAIERALAVHPNDPRLLAEAMQLADCTGNTDQALQTARALLRVQPDNARAKSIVKAQSTVEPPAAPEPLAPREEPEGRGATRPPVDVGAELYRHRPPSGAPAAGGPDVSVPVPPAAEVSVDRYADLLRDAEVAYQAGELERALRFYEKVLAVKPDHARSLYQKGLILKQRKDPIGAARLLEAALAARPGDTAAMSELGQLYMGQDKLDKAKDVFQKLVRTEPRNLAARYALAELCEKQEDLDGAAEQYRFIQRQYPELGDSYDYLGNLLYRQGRFQEALEQFQRLQSLSGNDPTARFKIGLIYYRTNRPERALEHFRVLEAQLAASHPLREQVLKYLAKLEPRSQDSAAAR
ncbi:MAG: tetratricopeptide repeat protein [Candidatus Riflebacteria bacterium]|nr:tetratricopeptide repeat protein [Candidatus Riflebacteria bacterium]